HALCVFFFPTPAPPEIYTLSLHDALPILWRRKLLLDRNDGPSASRRKHGSGAGSAGASFPSMGCHHGEDRRGARQSARADACLRSEEHTSELQSPYDLVCRLLLEKKNKLS